MHLALPLSLVACLFASSAAAYPLVDDAIVKNFTTDKNITNTPAAPLHIPITVQKYKLIDYVTDDEFNPATYRDGGGGGFINGYHVIAFADTFTTAWPGKFNSHGTSFVHNSFAYFGYRNKNNPSDLFDFGSRPDQNGTRTFMSTGLVAQGNETSIPNTKVVIWPNSNMVPLPGGTQALAVYSVYNVTQSQILYNTIAVIDVLDPQAAALAPGNTVSAERVVPRLFYWGENLYGSFGIYKSMNWEGEPDDGYLYLFSTSSLGIKVARVDMSKKFKRSSYRYWNGQQWSKRQPAYLDASANIITWNYYDIFSAAVHGPGAGDVFWSAHHQTYVTVFMGDGVNAAFFLSYSTTRQITGPWSTPQKLYDPGTNKKCVKHSPNYQLNYAGHAYPAWDPTGKTILLSWSSCNAWTSMASVTLGGAD